MQKQNMKLDMKSDIMEDAFDFGDDLENDENVNDFYIFITKLCRKLDTMLKRQFL